MMTETPDLHIRPATRDDLDALFALFAQVQAIHAAAEPSVFRPPVKDEAFGRYFDKLLNDPDRHVVFACRDGEAVGYVLYLLKHRPGTAFHPDRDIAYIDTLVVADGHRRSGCGSRLLEHAKQAARRAGFARLDIDFWSFNDAARACFRKAGFKISREYMQLDL